MKEIADYVHGLTNCFSFRLTRLLTALDLVFTSGACGVGDLEVLPVQEPDLYKTIWLCRSPSPSCLDRPWYGSVPC